jgi:50S ribosomal protein L16 3-hydroxylase
MTYSVGFRAPSRADLLGHYVDDVLDGITDDELYRDPDLTAQANAGEILPEALDRLQQMVLESLSDPAHFARWFGTFNSTPKYPDIDWRPEIPVTAEELRAAITAQLPLSRNPASRLAFIATGAEALMLFADGVCFDCHGETAALAKALCAEDSLCLDVEVAGNAAAIDLLIQLCNNGCIAFDSED